MKKLDEESKGNGDLPKETLKKISKVMDKGREVGIQEAIYRVLGLPLSLFSSKVKFINANHPERREGLLRPKAELENLAEGESVFHNSLHTYYEARPYTGELVNDETDWNDMSLAEFAANYEIVYKGRVNQTKDVIKLRNKKGYIVERGQECVIRYFLKHEHEQEHHRALCVLFLPFRNEMREIHEKNVTTLYLENQKKIEELRGHFEKNRRMVELLERGEENNKEEDEEEEDDEYEEEETTEKADIEDFIKTAKREAKKTISQHNEGKVRMSDDEYLQMINSLNDQQRKIFDDFCERILLNIQEIDAFYLYIAGEAGTGKSFLLRLMIEFVERLPKSSGQELDKPVCLTLAPTGVAAYIVGGVTIESGLCMVPQNKNTYTCLNPSTIAKLRFLYQDLRVIFIDEISMCSSDKLMKINMSLQQIFGNSEFMGGISVVTTGDFGQLPPVLQSMIWHNSHMDGRIDLSPNHWDENFTIVYLKEKMRSQDNKFSEICDKVRLGICDPEVKEYMEARVQDCPNESNNESFSRGKLCTIVATNAERRTYNLLKLLEFLPEARIYEIPSTDTATKANMKNPPPLDPKLPHTQTGGLEELLKIKEGAPVMITSNHPDKKYKNNGIVNGARGYIDSVQVSDSNPDLVEVIWVRFHDDKTGQLLRRDNHHLTKEHKTNDPLSVPIMRQKNKFKAKSNTGWMRDQFPLTLCYAITCHKVSLYRTLISSKHKLLNFRAKDRLWMKSSLTLIPRRHFSLVPSTQHFQG